MKTWLTLCALLLTLNTFAQNIGINVDGSTPDASAILDVKATNRGVLFPRLTTVQRDLIASPAVGLIVYNLDIDCFDFYDGISWQSLCSDNSTANSDCPEGMIDFGAFSIEDTMRAAMSYFNAVNVCHNLGSNTRLCHPSERYIACQSGLVQSITSTLEWTDDFTHENNVLLMGGCTSMSSNAYVFYDWPFRCCCEH
jgi:hypothetical protein